MSRRSPVPLSGKLYVGDLPRNVDEHELEDAFRKIGTVRNLWVARNPPGFAFVEYEDSRDASDAVRQLDGSSMSGQRIRVEHSTGKSRPKPWERNGGGGGGGGRMSGGARGSGGGRFGGGGDRFRDGGGDRYRGGGGGDRDRRGRSRSRSPRSRTPPARRSPPVRRPRSLSRSRSP